MFSSIQQCERPGVQSYRYVQHLGIVCNTQATVEMDDLSVETAGTEELRETFLYRLIPRFVI
jgi:hypothetical protein